MGSSTLNTIKIFSEFYLRSVREGIILPYDEDVISYLASHTNKSNSFGNYEMCDYLDTINNSIQSIEDCSLAYSRFIALGLKKPHTIYTARIDAAMFESGTSKGINYSWVETEDGVYDPIYRGIWPKKLWYKSFHPNMKTTLDSETEEILLKMVEEDTVESTNRYCRPLLSFGTSYNFQKQYFDATSDEVKYYSFQRLMFNKWSSLRSTNESLPAEMPRELVSPLVCDCIFRDDYSPSERNLACFHLLEFVTSDYEAYLNNRSYIERHYQENTPIVYNGLLRSYLGVSNFDPIVGDVVTSALPQSIIELNNSRENKDSLLDK